MSTAATATIMPGPTIIRAAVSRSLCEAALIELTHPVAVGEQDSYSKYELTPTCAEIAREAHKVSGHDLSAKTKTERFPRTMDHS
jgi:hypothetical protein